MTLFGNLEGFWSGITVNFLCMIVGALLTSLVAWVRRRRIVPKVEISVRRTDEASLSAVIKPRVLIAIYSGINAPQNPCLSEDDKKREDELFASRVEICDHAALGLSADTISIGPTIQAIDRYKNTLEKVILITTTASRTSVPLLRCYARDVLGFGKPIDAPDDYNLNPENDEQVTTTAYEKAKLIFADLGRERLYEARRSRTLVDVTGGTRSMQIGVRYTF